MMFNLISENEAGEVQSQNVRGALQNRWRYSEEHVKVIMNGYPDGMTLGADDIAEVKQRVHERMVVWTGDGGSSKEKQLLVDLLEYSACKIDVSVLHGGYSGRWVGKGGGGDD